MSYEILLYPRRPGQGWAEVVEADEEETSQDALQDEAALAEGVATFGRIEARLREELTGPVQTWVAEETGGDVFGEFTETDSGLQVELFHGSARVSLDDEGRGDPTELRERLRRAVGVVGAETGYEAYDPQTQETFDGTFAEQEEATSGVLDGEAVGPAPAGPAGPGAAATGAGAPGLDPRQEPSFLRRRGMLYLVLGVLLTLYGLWRLMGAGGTGWITVVVLVIGVLDLLGGLMMLSLARAAAERQAPERP